MANRLSSLAHPEEVLNLLHSLVLTYGGWEEGEGQGVRRPQVAGWTPMLSCASRVVMYGQSIKI